MYVSVNGGEGRVRFLSKASTRHRLNVLEGGNQNYPPTTKSLLELLRTPGRPVLHNVVVKGSDDELVMVVADPSRTLSASEFILG